MLSRLSFLVEKPSISIRLGKLCTGGKTLLTQGIKNLSISIFDMRPLSNKASALKDQQTFTAFYNAYASKVWGVISTANLLQLQSETIFINTLTEGWKQLGSSVHEDKYLLTKLLKIACKEGLPIETLQAILNSDRVLRPRDFS